jgi:hypothetical protein
MLQAGRSRTRRLATILFLHIFGSTQVAAELVMAGGGSRSGASGPSFDPS